MECPPGKTGREARKPRLTLPQHVLRRSLHSMSGLLFIYYLFPDRVGFVPKWALLIFIIGLIPAVIEFTRLRFRVAVFGQRPHEANTVAAFAWSLWTSLFIILVLPQEVALPVILVYTIADPVISELRVWKKWLVYPIGFLIVTGAFLVFGYPILLAMFGAFLAMLGEASEIVGIIRFRPELVKLYHLDRKRSEWGVRFRTDDNGTTQIYPAIGLGILYLLSPEWFSGPWFFPLY